MKSGTLVIPVHSRRDLTLKCLRHLRANGDLETFGVMVVDDGSTDGTADAIHAEFSEVEVLRGDGNLWWTGAIALGMRRAYDQGAATIGWLNDDCLPQSGALVALANEAAIAPGSIVAPVCLAASTNEVVPNGFRGRTPIRAKTGTPVNVDGLSGFCVLMSRNVVDRIGFPDAQRFPHYFGDNAYTLAASRAGFRCIIMSQTAATLVAYSPPPPLVATTRGWRQDFHREFVSPKSPRRVATLFAYQRLKYGAVIGTIFAMGRALAWILRLGWASLRS